jgi:hypothetical protein
VGRRFEAAIDAAVFPALQGGPHNHQIAALAVALREAAAPSFRSYIGAVKTNAKALAAALTSKGYALVSGGTDNHLVLWDLRPLGLTGSKLEKLCDAAGITLNKNAVHGDKNAAAPGGVRLGTPALTSRGLGAQDFEQVAYLPHISPISPPHLPYISPISPLCGGLRAGGRDAPRGTLPLPLTLAIPLTLALPLPKQVAEMLHEAVRLALAVQERSGPKLAAFVQELPSEPGVSALRERVQAFARRFPMPGEKGTDSFRP